MSLSFRAVKEEWSEATDHFVEREVLLGILGDIAARVSSSYQEIEYGEVTSVWIEKGKEFLDYVGTDGRFNSASVSASLEENGFGAFNSGDLKILLQSMKNLVPKWLLSVDQTDGSLRFYVD
jgi:hypothetical protein